VVHPADPLGLAEWAAEQARTASRMAAGASASPLVSPLSSPISSAAAPPLADRTGRHRAGSASGRGDWRHD